MLILAITDIPRMTTLLDNFACQETEIVVVADIHRGIDQLDNRNPDLVIFQNYLSGLSADILYKHLKSRLKGRIVRFALIGSGLPDDCPASRFDALLDPSCTDTELEYVLKEVISGKTVLKPPACNQTGGSANTTETVSLSVPPESSSNFDQLDKQSPYPNISNNSEPDINLISLQTDAPLVTDNKSEIISEFSVRLSASTDQIESESVIESSNHEPDTGSFVNAEHNKQQLHRLIKSPTFILIFFTLAIVLAISLFQHNSATSTRKSSTTKITQTALNHPVSSARISPAANNLLSSEKMGIPNNIRRIYKLPAFIPQDSIDKNYTKDHPGWELYRGQTNEYRIFRGKDAKIMAIQVLDRSGVGVQESFYLTALKELAGATSIKPIKSDIKEGYEIRRGDLGGLQIIQYRDAQSGRMWGFVITWP